MRFLRFLVLIVALVAVYAAQYLVDQQTLEFLRTSWVSENLPFLRAMIDWSPNNRQTLGLYLGGIGALLFGLTAYGWPRWSPANPAKPINHNPASPSFSSAFGLFLLLAPLFGGALLVFYLQQNPQEPAWTHFLWIVGIALYVLGSWLRDRVPSSSIPAMVPEKSWPAMLLMLVVVGFLLGWQLDTVPVRVDEAQATHGLQALQVAAGLENRIFAPSWFDTPLFAYYPAALGMALGGDGLLGSRLSGLMAGLLMIVGVWLLGCEIYRRPPTAEDGLDDGRIPALLAAAFTAVGYAFIYFGRLPYSLEAIAWGVLGLWALHRGVRTRSLPAMALAGLLGGLVFSLHSSGIIFWAVALLWWLWFALSRRGWMARLGWNGFALWAGGVFVFLAPFIGGWLRVPQSLTARFPDFALQATDIGLFRNGRGILLAFWTLADGSNQAPWQGPLLDSLVTPLLLLGIGYILLNLDRLQSWLLLSWLVAAVVLGNVPTFAPSWPWILSLLPVAGLLCAVAIDRARSTLVQAGAPWLGQFSLFIVGGLLVLAVSNNWVAWYETETVQGDPASYAGRAIRSLPADRTPVLLDNGDDSRARWSDPVVQFLAGGPYAKEALSINSNDWPANLPAQSSIILQPDDQPLAAELQSRYPGGVFLLQRNRQGDPVLIVYQLP